MEESGRWSWWYEGDMWECRRRQGKSGERGQGEQGRGSGSKEEITVKEQEEMVGRILSHRGEQDMRGSEAK